MAFVTDPTVVLRDAQANSTSIMRQGPTIKLPTAPAVGSGTAHQDTSPAHGRVTISGDKGERNLRAVFGTGAGLSMIDKRLAEEICARKPSAHSISVTGIGQSKTLGYLVLELSVPSNRAGLPCTLQLTHEFHVVEYIGCGLLVGNDILHYHAMNVDVTKGRVRLPNKITFPIQALRQKDHVTFHCREDCCIPANEHRWVSGRWSHLDKMPSADVVVDALLAGDESQDCWFATPSIILKTKLGKVLVTNVGDNDIFLSSNCLVATGSILGQRATEPVGEVLWSIDDQDVDAEAHSATTDARPFDVRDNPNHHEPNTRTEGTVKVDGVFDVGLEDGKPCQAIVDLLRSRKEAFSFDGTPGHVKYEPMTIPVEDESKLIAQPPRRLSPEKKGAADNILKKHIEQTIIEPSNSKIASPIVMVWQGKWRLCIDFRSVNDATTADRYPLQRMDDIFEAIGGSTIFSALDAVKGYHQLDLAEEDRWKTAFSCHRGLFQFTRVPFGLKNAPAHFQRFMDKLLGSMRWKTAMVYLDDVVVYSKKMDAHVEALRDLLDRAIAVGLRFDPAKCHFGLPSLKLLGRKVCAAGISVLPDRAEAIKKLAPPHTYKELNSVVGLFDFYRIFLPRFTERIQPLRRHLTKWRYKKNSHGKSQTLVQHKKGGEIVEVQASKLTVPWGDEEQKAFDFLKDWLCGEVMIAHPDHRLRFFLYVDSSTAYFAAAVHQQFLYLVDDKGAHLTEITWPDDDHELAKIQEGQRSDPLWSKFVKDLEKKIPVAGYCLRDDILIRMADDCICLPQSRILHCLTHAHQGHPGFHRTHAAMRQQFYHPSLAEIVRAFVRCCPECIRTKMPKRVGRMDVRTDDVCYPFHTVSLDIMLGLPKSDGDLNACLIMVDTFTKCTLLQPVRHTINADEISRHFEELILRRGWKPSRIITDRESRILKGVGKALSKKLGAVMDIPPAHHHQAVPAERYVQTAKTALRALIAESDKGVTAWVDHIPVLELSINSTPTTTSKYAPFDLLYVQHPRLLDRLTEHYGTGSLTERLQFSTARCRQAADAVIEARRQQKRRFDKRRQDIRPLKVNDEVMVRLPDRPLSKSTRTGNTLECPLEGPFKVKEVLSDHRVRLELPADVKVSDEFATEQVVLLPEADEFGWPGLMTDAAGGMFEPLEIVDERMFNRTHRQYQVRWKGSSRLTWMFEDDLIEDGATDIINAWNDKFQTPPPEDRPGGSNSTEATGSRSEGLTVDDIIDNVADDAPAEPLYETAAEALDKPMIRPKFVTLHDQRFKVIERPIGFASCATTVSQAKLRGPALEITGLGWAMSKFAHLLEGAKITVVTDHYPLLSILKGKAKNMEYTDAVKEVRAQLTPFLHNITFVHRAGSAHRNVDALSQLRTETDKK